MTGDISGNFIQKVLLTDTSDNLTCVVLSLNGLYNFFTNKEVPVEKSLTVNQNKGFKKIFNKSENEEPINTDREVNKISDKEKDKDKDKDRDSKYTLNKFDSDKNSRNVDSSKIDKEISQEKTVKIKDFNSSIKNFNPYFSFNDCQIKQVKD